MQPSSELGREEIGPAEKVEKAANVHLDKDEEVAVPASPTTTVPAIDPVIEKRVLRKLDLRVPLVTGILCMSGCKEKVWTETN
jgi:hypothetical protein